MKWMVLPTFLFMTVGAMPLAAQPKEAQALQAAMHQLIDRAEPAIACILVSRSERYRDFGAAPSRDEPGKLGGFDPRPHLVPFLDDARRSMIRRLDLAHADVIPEGYGSGVVIDAEQALVLTQFHVVQNATKIYVRLPGRRGSYADIHAADGRCDLAVLKLLQPPKDLKAITIGDAAKVRKGDWIVTLANPFAAGFRDGSPSASWGILSNVRRRAPGQSSELDRLKTLHQYGTLFQTDARLNLGCSGGALLNLKGELIGLTTSTAALVGGETAGGYAVPMDATFRRLIDILKRGEEIEYGFLGISAKIDEVTDRRGVIVDTVSEGTPGSRAGLQPGMRILTMNGAPIRDFDDLFLIIGTTLAGNEAVLEVERPGGRTMTLTTRLAKFSNPFPVIASARPAAVHGLRVDYSSVINSELPIPSGVTIRELVGGSPAEKKLRPLSENSKIVITSVNGKPITTPAEFYQEAARAKGAIQLRLIEVTRKPETTIKTITLP